MNLGDLLEELRENILHDRSDAIAGSASDQLWSDKTLVRYINQSHRRFARESLILRDGSTPSVTQVALTAGTDQYELHPAVIGVISAKYGTDAVDLARAGHSVFSTYSSTGTRFFDPGTISTLAPGKPLAYSTDEELTADDNGAIKVVNLRTFPAPSAAYLGPLKLRVVRLPLVHFDVEDLDAEPELPEDHHLEMLDWAAYLALRMDDLDAGSPNRANEFRASFDGHVKAARDAMMRKVFAPAQWGFGRGGWSYER